MAKDGEKKIKILLVCSGNTCRSPMAAAILQELLGDKYICISAGKSADDGGNIEQKAIDAVQKLGYEDIKQKKSRKVSEDLIREADMVFCLGDNVFDFVLKMSPEDKGKIFKYAPTRERVADPFDADGMQQDEVDELWKSIYGKSLKRELESDLSACYERRSALRGRPELYDYVATMMRDIFSPPVAQLIRNHFENIKPKEAEKLATRKMGVAKL